MLTVTPLRMLDWDSQHFGFPVAAITAADLDDDALTCALEAARQQGARVVYWHAPPDRRPAPQILDQYGGLLADHKATFTRRATETFDPRPDLLKLCLSRNQAGEPGCVSTRTRGFVEDIGQQATSPRADATRLALIASWSAREKALLQSPDPGIGEWPRGPAGTELRDLAQAAGALSRFRRDSRFSQERAAAMYDLWIERSCQHEIADAVLVARLGDAVSGMATVAVRGDGGERTGQVGLIAVAPAAQGQGVGLRLMQSVHQWLQERDIYACSVVTQQINTAACRLYRRAGYDLDRVESVWHFYVGVKR